MGTSGRMLKLFLIILGIITAPSRSAGEGEAALSGAPPPGQAGPPSSDTCWVYTHMNKSGGTTVKRLLRPALDDNGIKYGLYDNPQWKKGVEFLRDDFLKRNLQMVWGGYTEGRCTKRWRSAGV